MVIIDHGEVWMTDECERRQQVDRGVWYFSFPLLSQLESPVQHPPRARGNEKHQNLFCLSPQFLSPVPLPFVHACILNTTVPFNQVLVSATHTKRPSEQDLGYHCPEETFWQKTFFMQAAQKLETQSTADRSFSRTEKQQLREHSEMKTAAPISRCTAALMLAAFVCHLHSADYSSLLSCHNAPGAICNSNETFQTLNMKISLFTPLIPQPVYHSWFRTNMPSEIIQSVVLGGYPLWHSLKIFRKHYNRILK